MGMGMGMGMGIRIQGLGFRSGLHTLSLCFPN